MAHIVVVDDFPETLDLVQEILSPFNHQVACFDHPMDALAYLSCEKVDLLILDVRMPQLDGRQLLNLLYQHNNPYIPKVVLLCGAPEEGQLIQQEVQQPVVKILTKPFSVKALLDTVEEGLSHGDGYRFQG